MDSSENHPVMGDTNPAASLWASSAAPGSTTPRSQDASGAALRGISLGSLRDPSGLESSRRSSFFPQPAARAPSNPVESLWAQPLASQAAATAPVDASLFNPERRSSSAVATPLMANNPLVGATVPVASANMPVDQIYWLYFDPSGMVQGPFSGPMMHTWMEYFYDALFLRRAQDVHYITFGELKERIGDANPFIAERTRQEWDAVFSRPSTFTQEQQSQTPLPAMQDQAQPDDVGGGAPDATQNSALDMQSSVDPLASVEQKFEQLDFNQSSAAAEPSAASATKPVEIVSSVVPSLLQDHQPAPIQKPSKPQTRRTVKVPTLAQPQGTQGTQEFSKAAELSQEAGEQPASAAEVEEAVKSPSPAPAPALAPWASAHVPAPAISIQEQRQKALQQGKTKSEKPKLATRISSKTGKTIVELTPPINKPKIPAEGIMSLGNTAKVPVRSFADIQREQKAAAEARRGHSSTPPVGAAGGLGAGAPVVSAPAKKAPLPRQTSPAVRAPAAVSARQTSPVKQTSPAPSLKPARVAEELINWCRSVLRSNLAKDVNESELMQLFLSLPINSESETFMAESIRTYAGTINATRFAHEFFLRRPSADASLGKESWKSVVQRMYAVPIVDEAFTVVSRKKFRQIAMPQ